MNFLQMDLSENLPNGGIQYSTNCWWFKTSGEEKKPGALSRSPKQRMDDNSFISQLKYLKC